MNEELPEFIDLSDIQQGMYVTFVDFHSSEWTDKAVMRGILERGISGRVVDIGSDPKDGSRIVYLETFEPVPTLMAPKAVAPWLIQPEFMLDPTPVLGYGTLEAMKRRKVEIPAGMFDPKDLEKRLYYLDQPIPLADVREFCGKNYQNNPECLWQSVVLTVLPLHPIPDDMRLGRHEGGRFIPYDKSDYSAG